MSAQYITIAIATSDSWFEGVFLEILSIVRRTSKKCRFFILSGDFQELSPNYKIFTQKHADIIDKMIKKYNKQHSIKVIDCKDIFYQVFGDFEYKKRWKGWYPFVLFKLLFHKIEEFNKKVIYLDADIMANGDINELAKIEIKQPFEMAAARDLWRWHIIYDFKRKCFNAGVLLIDVDKIRSNNTFDKIIENLKKKKFIRLEQTALDKSRKIMPLGKTDYRFNYLKKYIKNDVILKHFLKVWKVRQWEIDKVHNILKLHNWDEDYKIYLEEKKKW